MESGVPVEDGGVHKSTLMTLKPKSKFSLSQLTHQMCLYFSAAEKKIPSQLERTDRY